MQVSIRQILGGSGSHGSNSTNGASSNGGDNAVHTIASASNLFYGAAGPLDALNTSDTHNNPLKVNNTNSVNSSTTTHDHPLSNSGEHSATNGQTQYNLANRGSEFSSSVSEASEESGLGNGLMDRTGRSNYGFNDKTSVSDGVSSSSSGGGSGQTPIHSNSERSSSQDPPRTGPTDSIASDGHTDRKHSTTSALSLSRSDGRSNSQASDRLQKSQESALDRSGGAPIESLVSNINAVNNTTKTTRRTNRAKVRMPKVNYDKGEFSSSSDESSDDEDLDKDKSVFSQERI